MVKMEGKSRAKRRVKIKFWAVPGISVEVFTTYQYRGYLN